METLQYMIYLGLFILLYKISVFCSRRLKKLDIYRKHVLITGGGSGLGKEIARECFYKGAYISLIGRNKANLLSTLQELESYSNYSQVGKFIQVFETDLAKNEKFEEIIKQCENRFGPVSLFISCVGVNHRGYFAETSPKVFKEQMENNYLSVVNSLLPISKLMCGRKKGRICVVSSALCYMPLPGSSAWVASKAAVHSLANAIRPELEKSNVYISIFAPGPIATPGFLKAYNGKLKEIEKLEGKPISVEAACTELLRGVSSNEKYITTHHLYKILRISSLGSGARTNMILDMLLSVYSMISCCLVSKYIYYRLRNLKMMDS